eukprot:SAG11_NODE_33385_length_277_cov_1.707865_1_plen_21_part_10
MCVQYTVGIANKEVGTKLIID